MLPRFLIKLTASIAQRRDCHYLIFDEFAHGSELPLGRWRIRKGPEISNEIEQRGGEGHDERPGDQQSENSVVGGRL